MTRLWDQDDRLDPAILAYTVGDDPVLDLELVPFDCAASIAHAEGLARIGVLTAVEVRRLAKELRVVHAEWKAGSFAIPVESEDVHTAIENRLTERLGDLGKKIHAGRSRNDQVLVCLRLAGKKRLIEAATESLALSRRLAALARTYAAAPMPGYSHTRQAMPTTVGHLFASWAEALVEDLELTDAAFAVTDRSPLGAAAGFGVALPLDRAYTARRLGFSSVQVNTLNAVSSRAKSQWTALSAVSGTMQSLARLAADVIVFSDDEHRFFQLAPAISTGSSIMPQKRNPDVFELIRANAQRVASCAEAVRTSAAGLGSGYHRDAQTTKGPYLTGLRLATLSLAAARVAIEGLKIDRKACADALSAGIFAADRANRLVAAGVPFREAYATVKSELDRGETEDPAENVRAKTHLGAPGNLALDRLRDGIRTRSAAWSARQRKNEKALRALLGDK